MDNDSSKIRKIIISVAGVFVAIIIISISIILYQNYLHKLEIVEIKNYPSALPEDMRDNLGIQLRRLLKNNFEAPDDVLIGASVREGTYLEDVDTVSASATFLIDIDDYKQTYEVVMNWSDEIEISDAILISCPSKRLMKYPETNCIAMYNDSQSVEDVEDNPIYSELPIIVNEFDFYARKNIHYEVRGYFNEDNELVLMIVDYSGGNLENGKKKIRDLGYNPEDFVIKYVNQAGDF